jgi:hypothetical protein
MKIWRITFVIYSCIPLLQGYFQIMYSVAKEQVISQNLEKNTIVSKYSWFVKCFSTFLLVYDSYSGVSLWHFCIYIYCTWFVSSPPLFSLFPSPLLKMTLGVWQAQCSIFTCVWKTLQPYSPLFMLFICPPARTFPKHVLVHIPVLHCRSVCSSSTGVCLGVLPVNVLYFNQSYGNFVFNF